MNMLNYYMYYISVALQLAGALVLLSSISTKRDDIIKTFATKSFISRNGNTNEISDISKAYRERIRQAYINRGAFLYLTLGYLGGVVGEKSEDTSCMKIFIVIIITAILLILARIIIDGVLMKCGKVIAPITNEDLERLGIEPDMESLSDRDINRIFGEVFDEKL